MSGHSRSVVLPLPKLFPLLIMPSNLRSAAVPAPDLAAAQAALDAARPAAATARQQPAAVWERFAEAITAYNQALARESRPA
jgi:hypothetical protein